MLPGFFKHVYSDGHVCGLDPSIFNEIKETEERWDKPEKYNYIVHAEKNGIYNACRNGVSLKDSICIVTFFPCSECARALIQVGVKTVVSSFPDFDHIKYGESFKYSLEMFNEVGINILYVK